MSEMFCYQCQESCKNEGCKITGMCGKKSATANLQDLLIYSVKGLSFLLLDRDVEVDRRRGRMIMQALFATITNANFDNEKLLGMIKNIYKECDALLPSDCSNLPHCAVFRVADSCDEFDYFVSETSILSTENDDIRSLRELLIYGLKGVAAYTEHAAVLGYEDDLVYVFAVRALASTVKELPIDRLIAHVLQCGETAVTAMALLDRANTESYGHPEITTVNTGVKERPAILISGHDLKDLEQLLVQTADAGVDVYTHSEMLPSHYYPAFKKFDNLVGNYGGSWWHQDREFESFNGPILMTTNCLTPVKDSYKDRIFTTGVTGYPGIKHIEEVDGKKDFSEIIALAKTLPAPTEIDNINIVGGFGHNQVLALADKVVEAVKSGAIKRFVVMGGCDGRHKSREYFTEVAKNLPNDTVILTAGCAKYRYNKLELGDIGGIPRVLDAGQCNDSYSLAVIALKLQEVFELEDINELPISFDIAWYEQKAVAVLLALLSLGVKGIRLGPTLPAFLSPTVVQVLVDNFDIKPIDSCENDIDCMLAGK